MFPALSVANNLRLGAWSRRRNHNEVEQRRQLVFDYFPRLAERVDQAAGTLSGGEQQMLAIGRALMSRPRLLLIDEASLGLSPALAKTVFQVVKRINDDGVTVIIVEQNVGVLPYADRALIMEKGTLIFSGVGDEIRNANLRETYLAATPMIPHPRLDHCTGGHHETDGPSSAACSASSTASPASSSSSSGGTAPRRTTGETAQIPYVISGGIAGLGLVVLGSALIVAHSLRTDRVELRGVDRRSPRRDRRAR